MNRKIVSLEELSEITTNLKKQGKKIVQCHGCFDLMHPGHIKHFEAAKNLGDVLVVTLTPDRFVNKGPGRPVFNEILRAESISALQAVDYVALNNWDTAIETIKLVKPDVYVKGQDYKDRSKDLTKNILLEEEALKSVGGEIHFTEEITFSSSSLINAHLSPHDERVKDFLREFRSRFTPEQVIESINDLNNLKVLVIGDTIVDEYHYCKPLGKSSKSPTISSVYLKGETYAGGVLAIANHLEQYAGKVDLVTCLGKEDSHQQIIEDKLSPGIHREFFVRHDGPTPTKRRYLDRYLNIKLFEVTFMNDSYIDKDLEKEIIDSLKTRIKEYDLVIISDFGHGMITPGIIEFLENCGVYLCVNAQTNSNNYGFNYITKYSRADYISIDENEIRLPFGNKFGPLENLIERLSGIAHCKNIQVTLGQQGSLNYVDGNYYRTPAFAGAVKDSVGAGDAVLSVTSLLSCAKADPEMIPFIGNCVGALAVEIIGNEHPVYKKDLLKFINHFLK